MSHKFPIVIYFWVKFGIKFQFDQKSSNVIRVTRSTNYVRIETEVTMKH